MAEASEFKAGTPSWVDIGTDVEGAKQFYGQLLGWEYRSAGPPEETGGYGFFTKGDKMVAGVGPQQNPGPPAWAVYVATEDAAAVVGKITGAGGKVVMEPMDVMGAGTMAVFQDPAGAFFSVWQPGYHKGAELVSETGAMCWVELTTRDVAGAKQFYPAVFGWDPETHEGEMAYTEFHLTSGADAIAGMMEMPDMVPAEVPSYWSVYFGVDSVDESTTKAVGLGAKVLAGPADIPGGGRFSVLHDPQGAVVGLFQAPAA
jgi:predicted enzyme related to lactoylglutathione lyase